MLNFLKNICNIKQNNDNFKYSKSNRVLIQTMNALNVISSFYIIIKNPNEAIRCIPHTLVCLTSAVFWRNTKNELLKILDYSCVATSLLYTWYWSFQNKREIIITPAILVVIYCFNMSMFFKRKNRQNICVSYHCITYLVANIGIVITFS